MGRYESPEDEAADETLRVWHRHYEDLRERLNNVRLSDLTVAQLLDVLALHGMRTTMIDRASERLEQFLEVRE